MKPSSMSMKQWLIKQIAKEKEVDQVIVTAIINDTYRRAVVAMDSCNSIDLTGFGRFLFVRKHAESHAEFLLGLQEKFQGIIDNPNSSELVKRNAASKKESAIKSRDILIKKLNK